MLQIILELAHHGDTAVVVAVWYTWPRAWKLQCRVVSSMHRYGHYDLTTLTYLEIEHVQ